MGEQGLAFDGQYYVLPSGRRFFANSGVIGLDLDGSGEASQGYDGDLSLQEYHAGRWRSVSSAAWLSSDRQALAQAMIRVWGQWAQGGGKHVGLADG